MPLGDRPDPIEDAQKTVEAMVLGELRRAALSLEPSIIPVFKTGAGRLPEHEGTGLLIRRGTAYYLVSAAHVFDACDRRPVLLDGALGPLANEPYVTNPPVGGTREDDRLDLGAVRLTDGEVAGLGHERFLPLELHDADAFDPALRVYVLYGYPISRQERDVAARRVEAQASRTFLSEVKPEEYKKARIDPRAHLLLRYREKQIEEEGRRGAPTRPRGNSGGGVWLLPITTSGTLAAAPSLQGIFIERPNEYGPSLLATRVWVLEQFLDVNGL